jgi:hypothetical protein
MLQGAAMKNRGSYDTGFEALVVSCAHDCRLKGVLTMQKIHIGTGIIPPYDLSRKMVVYVLWNRLKVTSPGL